MDAWMHGCGGRSQYAMARAKTMKTEPDVTTQREDQAEIPCMECPLHVAMEAIAQLAVRQHVLHLEGECQPRPELVQRLEQWLALYARIRTHICAATRSTTIPPDELERALDALLPPPTDMMELPQWRRLRRALAACATSPTCPLGMDAAERSRCPATRVSS